MKNRFVKRSLHKMHTSSLRKTFLFSGLCHLALVGVIWGFSSSLSNLKKTEIQVNLLFEPAVSNVATTFASSTKPQSLPTFSEVKFHKEALLRKELEAKKTPIFDASPSHPKISIDQVLGDVIPQIQTGKKVDTSRSLIALAAPTPREHSDVFLGFSINATTVHEDDVTSSLETGMRLFAKKEPDAEQDTTNQKKDTASSNVVEVASASNSVTGENIGSLDKPVLQEARQGNGSRSVQGFQAASAVSENLPPVYPKASERMGEEGKIRLRVEISASGLTSKVTVIERSGYARLDQAAIAAVKRWRFEPARNNGKPVETSIEVPIRFSLR
ncbi:MAG: TonB family protein [Rhodospirillales bacterium]